MATQTDFTNLLTSRNALQDLAHGVATEQIEASSYMTDAEVAEVVARVRAVNGELDEILDFILAIGERADD